LLLKYNKKVVDADAKRCYNTYMLSN
jgi:hypothetical protein